MFKNDGKMLQYTYIRDNTKTYLPNNNISKHFITFNFHLEQKTTMATTLW